MSDYFDKLIRKPIDLRLLIQKMDLADERVEDAAEEQPDLYMKASRYYVQKVRDLLRYKLKYESYVAKVGSRFREDKSSKGKRNLTEGAVKERVQLNRKVRRLRRKMEQAFVAEKFGELLTKAYQQRKDIIRILVEARWAEIGSALREAKKDTAKKMSRKLYKEVRQNYRKMNFGSDDE